MGSQDDSMGSQDDSMGSQDDSMGSQDDSTGGLGVCDRGREPKLDAVAC
jgi:hypothetical protein